MRKHGAAGTTAPAAAGGHCARHYTDAFVRHFHQGHKTKDTLPSGFVADCKLIDSIGRRRDLREPSSRLCTALWISRENALSPSYYHVLMAVSALIYRASSTIKMRHEIA